MSEKTTLEASSEITTRLQKGGALLGDMRQLVAIWSDDLQDDPYAFLMKVLNKTSLARTKDTYVRAFRPRFINGDPPQAWKLARVLEDANAKTEITTPFYYWITARSEKVLYDFVVHELMSIAHAGHRQIRVEEVMSWLRSINQSSSKEWSPIVTRKVARGLLAALRDFNVLEGSTVKKIAPYYCADEVFAIIAYCLHEMGSSGKSLVQHSDWRLFLYTEHDVQRAFLECHQKGWLGYQVAGEIYRIDFPAISFKELVHVILGR